jgi:hypothetical protein
MKMDNVSIFAAIFIVLGVIVLAFEMWAIHDRTIGNTISELVWKSFDGPMGKWVWWTVTTQMIWLTLHFATRGKF